MLTIEKTYPQQHYRGSKIGTTKNSERFGKAYPFMSRHITKYHKHNQPTTG